jgi:hypothetical protein
MVESTRQDMALCNVSPEGLQIASCWARPVTCRLSEPPKPAPERKDRLRATGLPLFDLAVRE